MAFPTEQEMRANPEKEFEVGENTKVWFDEDLGLFVASEIDCGDCGDSFESYEELVESV